MSCDLESSLDGWDRTFLDLSSKMAEPFCTVWQLFCYRMVAPLEPQIFENCATRAQEIATRVLIGLGAGLFAVLTAVMPVPILASVTLLGVGSRAFRAIGFALQKGEYTHVRGLQPEKTLDSQVKVMNWNICGIGGGMSIDRGGVIHWRSRVDAIAAKIEAEDPDVLILQEVYDTALAETLVAKFQANYAHFYMHLGPNVWGSVGGVMVLSKCAVHDFSHTSFDNNHWTLNRGFATLEIKARPQDSAPCARIIGTHLIHGDDKDKRVAQVAQIVNSLAGKTLLPTILAGDLNIERDQEGRGVLSQFQHAYNGPKPTCTNRLTAKWDLKPRDVLDETIDYISLFNGQMAVFEDCHLVEAFDETYNTQTARSDHHGVSVLIRF